jgi:cell division protein FtsL
MSRSAAATSAGRQRALPRPPVPHRPRRVSGPAAAPRRDPRAGIDASVLAAPGIAYPRPQRAPARPPLRVVAGGAAIAIRVSDAALGVAGSRFMDRLVRSRVWIGIVAFALIGIVAMQVSMLKLNNGIGRAVETVNTLERTNASLRGEVSRLSSGARIQSLASARGLIMPAPNDVSYLRSDSTRADAARAARRMIAPNAELAGLAGAPVAATAIEPPAAGTATGTPLTPDPAAPALSATPATDTAVAPVVPAPAANAAVPPAATTAPPAQVAGPTSAAPATTAAPSGGVAPPTGATGAGGP